MLRRVTLLPRVMWGARANSTLRRQIPTPVVPSGGPVRRDSVGLLDSEFSLDTFTAVLRLGADVFGAKPIALERIFVGMTRRPVDGEYTVAADLADWVRSRVFGSC